MEDKHTILTKSEIDQVLIERHTLPVHKKIRQAGAAIAGLGGLGSNVAVMLARAGIGSRIPGNTPLPIHSPRR